MLSVEVSESTISFYTNVPDFEQGFFDSLPNPHLTDTSPELPVELFLPGEGHGFRFGSAI
jgi:hypothetical protein